MTFAPPEFNADALTGQVGSRDAKPGKTAPRLLHDALLLDIQHPLKNFDILADAARPFNKNSNHPLARSEDACEHHYALNLSRTKIPPKDYRPAPGDHFWVEAVCRRDRTHIHIDLKYNPSGRRPCPNNDFPLHHFVRLRASPGSDYTFQCSSPDCGAIVNFKYYHKVISDSDVDILTNPDFLRKRYDEAVAKHGVHRGFVPATEVSTLWKLRRYVRDSLKPDGIEKKVPLENKRYLESFATDCDDVFLRLGFRKEGEGEEAQWALPQTNPEGMDSDRIFLENWDMELQILIDQFVARHGDLHPSADYVWHDAQPEMLRLLSAQSYNKSPQSRNETNPNAQDHPFYASLGAMRDFADELIVFAYERQADCDPPNSPYYFDCLQDLAAGRQSEELITKASFLESQGVVGQQAVVDAYSYFGLDPKTTLTDSQIVDRFRSRMDDTAASQQPTARAMLKRIGTIRQSRVLLDTAADTIETYAQALSWLSAEDSYPDDSILTLFTTKVTDNPETSTQARKAVQIIAETRNSDPLKSWLSTGEMRDSGMSVDDACAHLKINLKNVDEAMLQVVFDNARSDNPGWKTEQAIETVTKAYQKPDIGPQHDPSTWPVGLTSHGNTCYLNSLLQYYFTIKPLRDLVLDFDRYKFDLTKHGGKIERVGARKVTPLEIRAYQKFVYDLKNLFERMIRDRGPAVKPEADLVCRAFLQAEDTEVQTAAPSRAQSPPSDIGIEQPPVKPPRPEIKGAHPMMDETPPQMPPRPPQLREETSNASSKTLESNASSRTLGDDQTNQTGLNAHAKDQDDVQMHEAKPMTAINPPTPPDSPTLPSTIHDPEALDAPPLPPRPSSTPVRQQTNLAKAEEAARQQQDVTEVMDEILFRLRCAITPRGMDVREEQLDNFRDVFYMRISEKTLGDAGKVISREEDALNILLNIPSRPTDIYAALDEVFELQTIDHGTKKLRQYKTLQSLPPILQINIPRNTFDRSTGRGVKVEHKIHLEETLYLDRYFEWQDTDVLERRKATWGWRQRLDQLQAQKDLINQNTVGVDGPTKLQTAARYIRGVAASNELLRSLNLPPVEVDDSVAHDLDAIADAQRAQLSTIDEEATALQTRISTSFENLHQIKYRLHAVFFHRGGYGHGHYWTCIKDFHTNIWRQYNDEKVEEFKKVNDIFDAETWQQGTPTYAVYVKDDGSMFDYVEPVCRDPERTPESVIETTDGPVDEVMQDAPPAPPNYPPPQPQTDPKWQAQGEDLNKNASPNSLCLFCAHRLVAAPSPIYATRKPHVRIQRRGIQSSAVSPRAAEATATARSENDPFDPFGAPLPKDFVNPEEAAKANLERIRQQRAQETEEARQREEQERIDRLKRDDELDSRSVFKKDPKSEDTSRKDQNTDASTSRTANNGQMTLKLAPRTRTSTGQESLPHPAFRRQIPDVPPRQEGLATSRSESAGESAKRASRQREQRQKFQEQVGQIATKDTRLADSARATTTTSAYTKSDTTTSKLNLKQAMSSGPAEDARSKPQISNRPPKNAESTQQFTMGRRSGGGRPSGREKAIADITEKMKISAMPRLDREKRLQQQPAHQTPRKNQTAFPSVSRSQTAFPSFRDADQASKATDEQTSQWAHTDVPEVPPEMQARIDEEDRLAEERRLAEEKQRAEARRADEERRAEELRIAEERHNEAKRKESERRLREAQRRKQKQEDEARQIAQAAKRSALYNAQQSSNHAVMDTLLGGEASQRPTQQTAPELLSLQSSPAQSTSPAQPQDRDGHSATKSTSSPIAQAARLVQNDPGVDAETFSFKIDDKGQLISDMTDEEIDMTLRLLELRRKRTKAAGSATAQQTNTTSQSQEPPSPHTAQNMPVETKSPAEENINSVSGSPEIQSEPYGSQGSWSRSLPDQSQNSSPAHQSPPRSTNPAGNADRVVSDLMRQGMMAGAGYEKAPMISLKRSESSSADSDANHFQRDSTRGDEAPAARKDVGRSPLMPFDPALTSNWNIFKVPKRKDSKSTSAQSQQTESSNDQPDKSSRFQHYQSMRQDLSTAPGDNPFSKINAFTPPDRTQRKCNFCGQPGHFAFFCPERKKQDQQTPPVRGVRGDKFKSAGLTGATFEAAKEAVRTPPPRQQPATVTTSQGADTLNELEQELDAQERPRPNARRTQSEPLPKRTKETKAAAVEDVDEDLDDDEPQITLRSRKFAEPEEDEKSQRRVRGRRQRDDDDLDEDFGGRRKGGRRASMRDEDDEDFGGRGPRRRARDDEDELDEMSGVKKIRDKRQRERDERRAKARQAEQRKQALAAKRSQALTKITLPQFITVSRLAQALNVKLDSFTRKMESLGFTTTAHDHVLSAENASLIALEYNFDPTIGSDLEVTERDLLPRSEPEDKSSLPTRPPIVTIMGHVDHGKTTILDYLRKSSIAASEHGGITQHIGAFSVRMSGGKTITFLDTPGHAAFLSMRKRGANVTDMVILVVAADDSVKPQTLEALKHAREAKVPILVAVNKVDKPEADVQRVKNDLSRHGVEIEDFGGDVQVVPVSGKTGQGMDDLEEAVVTLGEILDHRAEVEGGVEGWVLEATTKAAGRVATVLVRRGTLKSGDVVVAGQTWTKVRTLRNEAGVEVHEAGPGTPVEVDGWRDQPAAGDMVLEAESEQKATDVVDYRVELAGRQKLAEDVEAINEARRVEQEKREKEKADADAKASGEEGKEGEQTQNAAATHQEIPFIVKADVSGSVEAVVGYLQQLMNAMVSPKILRSGVGPVTEFDIEHAAAAQGHIICFNLPQPSDDISGMAQHNKVKVIEQNVIYRLLEQVKSVLEEKLEPIKTQRVIGEAEVLKPFDISVGGRKKMRIAGSRVRNGEIKRNSRVRVTRNGKKVYDGTVQSLKNVKKDVTEMRKGTECGIGFEDWTDAQEGDQIQTYEEISEKRALPI
ncbi:Translation initiation factor IF-2 [Elsinoe australis]|uniref:Translation initiation factor IF-2, mitochondrial n=1 Tax=Elsinoe australis TaxID=40998 RepID=A0A2P8A0F3_9PEZI|nr:Translation initiation factor IF-2 [Elsinoe australis]